MTDDDRIRALIVALEDWRDEFAEIEKNLQVEGLTRSQRLTLEGDKVIMRRRIEKAKTLLNTYHVLGMLPQDREWFAREVGERLD